MKSIKVVQGEVAAWALKNFGRGTVQTEDAIRVLFRESTQMPGEARYLSREEHSVEINSLGSLLGIVEEFGELCDARNAEQEEDAVGDMLVYLCDYCAREGMPLPNNVPAMTYSLQVLDRADLLQNIGSAVGRLSHCTLKRLQGIRGFNERAKYEEARGDFVLSLLQHLDHYALERFAKSAVQVLNKTWDEVQKRDWTKNAQSGT